MYAVQTCAGGTTHSELTTHLFRCEDGAALAGAAKSLSYTIPYFSFGSSSLATAKQAAGAESVLPVASQPLEAKRSGGGAGRRRTLWLRGWCQEPRGAISAAAAVMPDARCQMPAR